VQLRGREARLASDVASDSTVVFALWLSTARASQRPAEASSGSSRSWRWSALSTKRATSSSVSRRATPRNRSRSGPPRRSTWLALSIQSRTNVLGETRARRAPITPGDSQSFSTMLTMLSMIFARRAGMMAVCGIGSPSG
jgi:hypothetical protein